MGVVARVARSDQLAVRVQQPRDHVTRNLVVRHEDRLAILGYRNQTAIEHPVQRARQRQTVADGVAAVMLDRFDMRRLNLGPSAAVAQLQPRHRAAIAIGRAPFG